MSNLDWKVCQESGQSTAQGDGVTYWLVESKGSCSLWINPDSIDDGYTDYKGTIERCKKHAELREKAITKETRTKIPPEVTRVYDAFTGELKVDIAAQLRAEIKELKGELLICEHALSNALEKILGSRQHVTTFKNCVEWVKDGKWVGEE